MDILLSTDKNYIMPTGVTMKSVSVNNEEVTFHVLIDEGVSAEQKLQLESVIDKGKKQRVLFYLIDSSFFEKFPALGRVKKYITKATYYRLLIADVIPNDIKKIIYLDGDIIVRHPLDKLWNTNLDNYAVGVVEDMGSSCGQDMNRLGYPFEAGYFNAGVLFINLDYWRNHHLKDLFMEVVVNHPEKICWHDQDVLNITLYDKKLNLPLTYNFQNGFLWKAEYSELGKRYHIYEKEILRTIGNPTILHFTDQKKPWHIEDCNPYGFEFIKYYKQTLWKYMPLTHCYKSEFRHVVAKVLRKIHVLKAYSDDEKNYYNWQEINQIKDNYE